jgi:hypothetical protein
MPSNITEEKFDNDYYHQYLNRIKGIGGEDTKSNDIHFKKQILDVGSICYLICKEYG